MPNNSTNIVLLMARRRR